MDSGEFRMQTGQMVDELEAVWLWFRSIGGRWKQLISHYLVHGKVSRLTFELSIKLFELPSGSDLSHVS